MAFDDLSAGSAAQPRRSGPLPQRATYRDLVNDVRPGKLVRIKGIGGLDAYNPHLIQDKRRLILAARVEPRDSDWMKPATWHPQVQFFERKRGAWQPLAGAPVFENHEDPYATWIVDARGERQLLLGAVTLDRTNPDNPMPVTRFYMAPSVEQLDPTHPIAEIYGMKDGFRVVQMPDGSLLMSTRPADGRVGGNVLGLLHLRRIEDVSAEKVARDSVLLDTGLDDGTFLAVNEMHWVKHTPTGERHIGVLGCLSQADADGKWSFAAAVWFIDPARATMTRPEVIAERGDFPIVPPKADYLADVLFPGSLVAVNSSTRRVGVAGQATLFTGVSDADVGELSMEDPLARHDHERIPAGR